MRKILSIDSSKGSILYRPTKNLTKVTESDIKLMHEMVAIMQKHEGVGLAANQIGESKSIFVFINMSDAEKPRIEAIINPAMEWQSKETEPSLEACLSLPGRSFIVERSSQIRLRHGLKQEKLLELKGLSARIAAHESSHLDGILVSDVADNEVSITENVVTL